MYEYTMERAEIYYTREVFGIISYAKDPGGVGAEWC